MSLLPQVVSIGPLSVNLYSLLIAGAAALSLSLLYRRDASLRALLGLLVVAASGVVVGQLGYIGLHAEAAREGALTGGISEHAALFGAWLSHRWVRARLSASLDSIFWTATGLIGVAACLGCIPNGCGFGREVFWQSEGEDSLAWQMHVDWPDMTLTLAPRLPAQALLAAWLAIGIVLSRWRAAPPGAEMGVAWFAIGDFLIQFLRGDDVLTWGGLRLYQWLDIALLLIVMTSRFRMKANRVNYGAPPTKAEVMS